MSMGQKQRVAGAIWEQPDAELVCLLCGSVVAEAYGPRIRHRPDCPKPLRVVNGRPRCCHCGGALMSEQIAGIWGAGPNPTRS
jgi:hypothetical protein